MIVVSIPFSKEEVWHGSSRSDKMFLRDAVWFWFEAQNIPRHVYITATDDNDGGIFLFDKEDDAMLFKLTWA